MKDAEIRTLAERVLGDALAKHGLERIEVRTDRDDPDEPALYVDADLGQGVQSLPPGTISLAHHDLSETLLEAGDARFPYFLLHYTDKTLLSRDSPRD